MEAFKYYSSLIRAMDTVTPCPPAEIASLHVFKNQCTGNVGLSKLKEFSGFCIELAHAKETRSKDRNGLRRILRKTCVHLSRSCAW